MTDRPTRRHRGGRLAFRAVAIGLSCAISVQSFGSTTPARYEVGAGDELTIGLPVKGELADLSRLAGTALPLEIVGERVYERHQEIVAPDGTITLPTLNTIPVSGMSLDEVRATIDAALKADHRPGAAVVTLTRSNSAAYFVWGEVKTPGRFVFERPTTLLQALGTGGGPTDHANMARVRLVHRNGAVTVFDLSAKKLDRDGAPDVPLVPSDTIIVPKKLITPDSPLLYLIVVIVTAATGVVIATRR